MSYKEKTPKTSLLITRVYKFLVYDKRKQQRNYEYRSSAVVYKIGREDVDTKRNVKKALDTLHQDVFNSVKDEFGFETARNIIYLSTKNNKEEIDAYFANKEANAKKVKLNKIKDLVTAFIKQDYDLLSKISSDGKDMIAEKKKSYVIQNVYTSDKDIQFENAIQNTGYYFPINKSMLKFSREIDVYFYVLNKIRGYENEMYNENFTIREYVDSFVCGYKECFDEKGNPLSLTKRNEISAKYTRKKSDDNIS